MAHATCQQSHVTHAAHTLNLFSSSSSSLSRAFWARSFSMAALKVV